jgi:hypothetical protein
LVHDLQFAMRHTVLLMRLWTKTRLEEFQKTKIWLSFVEVIVQIFDPLNFNGKMHVGQE